jgi:hypothetical protein
MIRRLPVARLHLVEYLELISELHQGVAAASVRNYIVYGHGSDENQNPRKIKIFEKPFPEGFLARKDNAGRAVAAVQIYQSKEINTAACS